MPVYIVTRKSDSVEVSRYAYNGPAQDTAQWPFADYTHTQWVEDAAPAAPVRITRLAFRQRFDQTERVAIEIAALDDPTQAMGLRAAAATVRAYQADVEAAEYIDLNDQATRDGVQQLESSGLLSLGRAAVILDTPPTVEELWHG